MCEGDSGILRQVIKCFGITNISVHQFAAQISTVQTVPKYLRILFCQQIECTYHLYW